MTLPSSSTINQFTENLPAFQAVLWDMDGTLVDSEPLHAKSVKVSGKAYDIDVTDEILARALGVSHRYSYELLQRELGLLAEFDEWMELVERNYLSMTDTIPVLPDALELVRYFHARNIPQAVVSNNASVIVTANIQGLLRDFRTEAPVFHPVITLDDISQGKPSPEGYLLAARKLGVAPQSCLVFEDTPTGVRAGTAAGCYTILRPQRSFDHADISPNRVVNKFTDLKFNN